MDTKNTIIGKLYINNSCKYYFDKNKTFIYSNYKVKLLSTIIHFTINNKVYPSKDYFDLLMEDDVSYLLLGRDDELILAPKKFFKEPKKNYETFGYTFINDGDDIKEHNGSLVTVLDLVIHQLDSICVVTEFTNSTDVKLKKVDDVKLVYDGNNLFFTNDIKPIKIVDYSGSKKINLAYQLYLLTIGIYIPSFIILALGYWENILSVILSLLVIVNMVCIKEMLYFIATTKPFFITNFFHFKEITINGGKFYVSGEMLVFNMIGINYISLNNYNDIITICFHKDMKDEGFVGEVFKKHMFKKFKKNKYNTSGEIINDGDEFEI